MPPRFLTNPAPKTESARASLKSFYCELCSKGYARQNEFDAHESSYDHQHKKRLKDMKAMSKDPSAAAKARKAEQKAAEKQGGGLIKISLGVKEGGDDRPGVGGGIKKGGFKSAFGTVDKKPAARKTSDVEQTASSDAIENFQPQADESDEEDADYYDPRQPTGCPTDCNGRR